MKLNTRYDTKIKKFFVTAVALLVLAGLSIVAMPNHAAAQYVAGSQWQTNDNFAWLSMSGLGDGCGIALTTGAFAANPANSGGQSAPALVRIGANNTVYQATTSAAASALTLTCDLTPQSLRTTAGKGVTITGIQVLYGVQTTALTSISGQSLSSVSYPAANGTAAATVAAAGGSLTTVPALASAQLALTTSGLCYNQTITLQNPVTINSGLQRLTFEEVFNQTAATATVYQICGVGVYYQQVIF